MECLICRNPAHEGCISLVCSEECARALIIKKIASWEDENGEEYRDSSLCSCPEIREIEQDIRDVLIPQ